MGSVEKDHLRDLPPVLGADLGLDLRPADAVLEEQPYEGRVVIGVVEPSHDPLGYEVGDRAGHQLARRLVPVGSLDNAVAQVPYDSLD